MKKISYTAMGVILTGVLIFLAACDGPTPPPPVNPDGPRSLTYSIGPVYPHDTSSFTEGLLIYKGELYESAGDYGKSKLLRVDLKTGKALQSLDLDKKYFGEGIVIINDTIY